MQNDVVNLKYITIETLKYISDPAWLASLNGPEVVCSLDYQDYIIGTNPYLKPGKVCQTDNILEKYLLNNFCC